MGGVGGEEEYRIWEKIKKKHPLIPGCNADTTMNIDKSL